MAASKAVPVTEFQCILGESPIWSPAEGALYFVDIYNAMIHRVNPAGGAHDSWPIETEIGSIGFTKDKTKLIAGLRSGIVIYDLAKKSFETIADPDGKGRLNELRMNEGKVDRGGRFWVGTMRDPGRAADGVLYRVGTDRSVDVVMRDITVPNATSWSPDGRIMYFADSPTRTISSFETDPSTGEIGERKVFVTVPEGEGFPDGGTVDAEGYFWGCRIFGGKIVRYDPDGEIDREIALPTPQVTSCAFGGPDMTTLYVTTASMRMDRDQLAADPMAGRVFAIETDVKGIAEPAFAG